MDKKVILEKYGELHVKYCDMQIDDFENYIGSRLIEYIFNLYHADIDKIVDLVRDVIENHYED